MPCLDLPPQRQESVGALRRLVLCAALLAVAPIAGANGFAAGLREKVCGTAEAVPVYAPDSQRVEVGFSPEGGAEALVRKVILSAKTSIRLAGYSFTSPAVVRELIDAKRRGVDVAVVVDHKSNSAESQANASRQALNLLVNAGIPTRTVSVYAIHHDKYMAKPVETGPAIPIELLGTSNTDCSTQRRSHDGHYEKVPVMASVQPATALSQGDSKFVGVDPLHIISSDRRVAPYDNFGSMGKLNVTKERV